MCILLMFSQQYFNYIPYKNKLTNKKSALAQAEIQIVLTKKDKMDRATHLPCNEPSTHTSKQMSKLVQGASFVLNSSYTTSGCSYGMGCILTQRNQSLFIHPGVLFWLHIFIQINSRSENILQNRKSPIAVMKCFCVLVK